ncbi:hypothetical protein [Gelidibacter salicanalis]|uniref:Uncharacterized protein n=1 Tax=Gelidibacter salicanalis TaxID=291193 RepID=A0A934KS76_9FLAO|nr:hypothetical protein [Gelidibacter salicanalis]MBJ7880451.1 hypothetical protein [Gelidibacter salicanalis]
MLTSCRKYSQANTVLTHPVGLPSMGKTLGQGKDIWKLRCFGVAKSYRTLLFYLAIVGAFH